jgi:hypothetical protein
MTKNVFVSVLTRTPPSHDTEWTLYDDGHILAGAIVERDANVEAQILLDGQPLYRSRHASRDVAERELVSLRGRWAREGWIAAV